MINDSYVLIVSTVTDVASDDVVRRLTNLGVPLRRINTEDLPFSRTFSYRPAPNFTSGWLTIDGQPLPVPMAVWYRRLRAPTQPTDMEDGIYTFCMQETRAALLGDIMALSTRWMSHPAAVWQSEFKPFQLSLAAKLGLRIPRTIVTNDPDAIRQAFNEFGTMIVKPVRSGYVELDGGDFVIFTSQVLREHLEKIDSARWSPAIYQNLISKRFDIRVTIVGRKIFAAAIDSQRDPMATIDWRHTMDPALPHYPVSLPDAVANRLLDLMNELHLSFGAIDLIETLDNEFVFLEVNPSGQWLWLDDKLQLGISDAIAEWLGTQNL
jgi:glutathione synthase/RimK-type ligase-like ATP-grasp enzyme